MQVDKDGTIGAPSRTVESRPAKSGWLRWIATAAAAAVASFLAAKFGLALLAQPSGVALFWPSAGLTVGARLALGRSVERPMALGVALATFVANISGDRNAPLALAFAAINVLEFVLVARMAESWFGRPFRLDTLWRVWGFFLTTLLGTAAAALAATVAIVKLTATQATPFETWQIWLRSDAIGVIGIAPLFIALRSEASSRYTFGIHLEGMLSLSVLALGSYLLFSAPPNPLQPWTLIPPVAALFPVLLLIAARLPHAYAAAAVTIVTLVVVATTASGAGRFSDPTFSPSQQLLFAQIVIVSAAVCALALAALVAERRWAERHQRMLISQLDHRVKNSLEQVQAIIERSQEGARSIDAFVGSLGGRIRAIARTHKKLSAGSWQGLCLETLIRDELAPYRSAENILIGGPPVRLTPAAAQPLSLVIHELATNAAKYGALSAPSGRVEVRWAFEGPSLSLVWRESGGPPVKTPQVEGYGTSTIRDILPYEVSGGSANLDFDAKGVVCRISLPAGAATEVEVTGALINQPRSG